ncbi:MAG: hypothetical protein HYT80_09975 [Euryarchaeota archaeon]|nr:hypothetical protein [Euryarchaeota archaeon]
MDARLVVLSTLVLAATLFAGCTQEPAAEGTPIPASGREPKNLVERLTINMAETDSSFYFAEPGGSPGGPFQLSSGKIVGIHFINVGDDEHEFVAGRGVKYVPSASGEVPDGYNEALFESLPADVFVYKPQKVEVATEGGIGELEAEAGGDFWVRTTFPDSMKGTWEMGCFKPGHYEGGMKATLVIA